MSSAKLLLITGVSGHIGFRVLAEALARGHRVRAVIRKAAQAEQIKETASVKPYVSQLEFAVVADLLAPGSLDDAVQGVTGVIHLASPLPKGTTNYKEDLIDPAINATKSLLYSALKAPTVNRVVITSSVAVLLPFEYIISNDTERILTVRDAYTPTNLESGFANPMHAYGVSKAAAHAATKQFIADEKPHFEVVNVLPSMVTGHNELNHTREEVGNGSNGHALGVLLTNKSEMPGLGASVHIDDVARLHLDALETQLSGNRDWLASSGGLQGTTWDDAKDIARKLFPKAVADGTFPLEGSLPSRPLKLDSSETEAAFGWKFASFEEQIKSLGEHYLSLPAAAEKL